MKKLFTLLTFLCVGFVSAFAVDPPTTKDGYDLVWCDQFDGTKLDEKRWNIEVNGDGGGNGELQYYNRDGVSVRDGNLVLTAKRQPSNGKAFTSGRINSLGKVFFKFGKVEALIKLPKTYKGLWPAFWMMGNDYPNTGWPACGELDIVEMGHSNGYDTTDKSERFLNGALHYGTYYADHQQLAQDKVLPFSVQDGDYHLFSCEWTDEVIKCSVDGEVYFSTDYSGGRAAYFKKPNFIIFNLAIGGMFPGISNPADITAIGPKQGDFAEMMVDYVAVYQKAEEKNLIDVEELSGNAGKIKVDEPVKPVFDQERYYVINIDDDTFNGPLAKKEVVDLRVNDKTRFIYTWEDTFIFNTPIDNFNANGTEGGILSVKGNNYAGWTGLGYNISAAAPADLTGISDKYYLHFDVRTTSSARIEITPTASGSYKIVLGGGGDADFPRDGKWHTIDVPVTYLMAKGLFFDTAAMSGNIIALSIGNSPDAVELGGIYFYGPSEAHGHYVEGNGDILVGESSTLSMYDPTGAEVSATWEVKDPYVGFMNGNTFVAVNPGSTAVFGSYNGSMVEKLISVNVLPGEIEVDPADAHDFSADTYYITALDETTTGTLKSAGKDVIDLKPNLYLWEGTIAGGTASGPNAYGVDGAYSAFVSTPKGWSGAGYSLSGNDLTGITYEYTLHLDVKSTSTADISFTVCSPAGDYAVTLGTRGNANFTRDGKWHCVEIPMSYFYAKGLNYGKASNYATNIVTFSTGSVANVEFGISGVYFYSPKMKEPDTAAPVINVTEPVVTDHSISFGITAIDRTSPISITVKEGDNVVKTFSGVRSGVAQTVAIDNLEPNTSHTYVITATDGADPSNTATETVTAKTAVADLAAPVVVVGTPKVTTSSISFTVTATDDSAPVTIVVKEGDEVRKTINNVASGATTTVTFDGLAPTTTYTYTVTAQDNSAARNISEPQTVTATTATPVPVSGVSLDKETAELTAGEGTLTLVATVNPSDAANKAVTWSSSNEAVATVSNGVVTPVAPGEATITVTTVDGGKTATCVVTVKEPVIPEIEPLVLTKDGHTIKIYPVDNGNGTYTLVVKSAEAMYGTSGTHAYVNGQPTHINGLWQYSDDHKTMTLTVTSGEGPQVYTPFYVMMPGEVNFGSVKFNWQKGKLPEDVDPIDPVDPVDPDDPDDPDDDGVVEPLVVTKGTESIALYPVINEDGSYTLIIKSKNSSMNGFSGTFVNVNGKNTQLVNVPATYSDDKKTVEVNFGQSANVPNIYTPLYIMMPGEINFGQPNLDWKKGKPSDKNPFGDPDGPEVIIPSQPAPLPTVDAMSVRSLYSDSYNRVTDVGYLEGWGQSTTLETGVIEGDNYLHYKNLNYIGWGLNPAIDVSDMQYLHLDICPKADGSIRVYPIYGGPGKQTDDSKYYTIDDLKAGEWKSCNISLTEFPGLDFSSIFQIKFAEPSGFAEFCLDNVYFYTEGGTGIKFNTADTTSAKVFGLNGQQYDSNAKLAKGIYVVNGKKVVK